jgi:isocitrate lyase
VSDKNAALEKYLGLVGGKTNEEAREVAKEIVGEEVWWDWDRTSLLPCLRLWLY